MKDTDPMTAPPAEVAAQLAYLENASKEAAKDLTEYRRGIRMRYAPYTQTVRPGTHHFTAEDGTPIKVEISEESKWDSDALQAIVEADPRFKGVVRAKYDVLAKDYKRAPREVQEVLDECRVVERKDPAITLGNTSGDQA